MFRLFAIFCLCFASVLGEPALAQPNPMDIANRINKEPMFQRGLPSFKCNQGIDDPDTKQACWAAQRSLYEYYQDGHQHRKDVFAFQSVSTKIIFFTVIFLVLVGVYFSWLQFRLALQAAKKRSEKDGDAELTASHELKVSTEGVEARSSYLGVIILTLSLAFFYLYIAFVYPIQETI